MAEPLCVISGVGPGTGTALVRRFAAGGYRVAMLARNAERLGALTQEIPSTQSYVCDVSDQAQVDAAMERIERDMGAPGVLIHNAVGGGWGSFMEIDPAMLNRNFQVNTMGLLYLARRVAPAMVAAGKGVILVTATPRRSAAGPILPASPRPRRHNAFWRKPWPATSGQRACMSPIS
jgi:NAD(P)-dependent dehydrogenase (short-subunit alcohol dehydrogenase family)